MEVSVGEREVVSSQHSQQLGEWCIGLGKGSEKGANSIHGRKGLSPPTPPPPPSRTHPEAEGCLATWISQGAEIPCE